MRRIEQGIQRSVLHFIRLRYPKTIVFHIPNGGGRSKIEAAIFKGLGVMAGVADLCVLWRDKEVPKGRVGFLEVKAPSGKLSPKQHDFALLCKANEIPYGVVSTIDEAQHFLALWGCR